MHIPASAAQAIWRHVAPVIQRVPDEIIGHQHRWRATEPNGFPVARPFLLRWFIHGEKHRWGNAYLHQFIRNDEDRALHDHPWYNMSLLLGGQYIEHTIDAGGINRRHIFRPGDVKLRSPKAAHRVELTSGGTLLLGDCPERAPNLPTWVQSDPAKSPAWSLFLTGPVQRKWGFHCPQGWKSNRQFGDEGGC
jgi:hypothetical protein